MCVPCMSTTFPTPRTKWSPTTWLSSMPDFAGRYVQCVLVCPWNSLCTLLQSAVYFFCMQQPISDKCWLSYTVSFIVLPHMTLWLWGNAETGIVNPSSEKALEKPYTKNHTWTWTYDQYYIMLNLDSYFQQFEARARSMPPLPFDTLLTLR